MGPSAFLPRNRALRVVLALIGLYVIVVLPIHYSPSLHDSLGDFVSQRVPDIHLGDLSKHLPGHSFSEDNTDATDAAEEADKAISEEELRKVVTEAAAKESLVADDISTKRPPTVPPLKASVYGCPGRPDAADFLISMKTGATELFAKLPEQLLTTLRCVPNYMIFSDLEQDIGDYHIYSSLEEVSDKYKYSHRDFEFYRKLLDLSAKGQDLSLLKATHQAKGHAWDLDKWKFIPITHRVYKEQPNVKWYVFIEADAYMAWPNVMELLSHYNPDEPWYLGAVHFFGDVAFAHGGMGYIISNGAMRLLDDIWDPKHIALWERRTAEGCCGDVELAAALVEAGVNITGIPGLYGESLSWFEWDEGKWCEPSLSWHHVRAHDVEALWQFETKWMSGNGTHYVYRDLFNALIEPHLTATRTDWDNMSSHRIYTGPSGLHGDEDRRYKQSINWEDLPDGEKDEVLKNLDEEQTKSVESTGKYTKDTRWDELSDEEQQSAWEELTEAEKQAHESLHKCRAACEDYDECMQYWFTPGRCHLHRTIRLGRYVEADEEEDSIFGTEPQNRTVSGWMRGRIDDFRNRMEPCKPVPEWMDKYAEAELS